MKYIFDFYNTLIDDKDKITFIATIITLIGIFFTLIVGLINVYISQKRLGLENITSNRVEWINTLRKYVSDFITASDLNNIQAIEPKKEVATKFREVLSRTSSLIKLHLNFKGEIDKRIINELNQAIDNIYLFLNLRISSEAMSIHKPMYSEGLKFYLDKYIDEDILRYLIEYSIKNNENTQISPSDKMETLAELKKFVISEYCSVINGVCYADKFRQELGVQYTSITENLRVNRYNIIKLTQIYLKAEWIRVKKETKSWPFSIYREKHTLKKLEEEWNKVNNKCT